MHFRLTGAVIAALCLTAPARAQDKHLYLVLYVVGSTQPRSIDRAPPDRAACERRAAYETAKMAEEPSQQVVYFGPPTTVDRYVLKCEFRGPNDMLWKLKPWLKEAK